MADQTVSIVDSSGSPERVALDLCIFINRNIEQQKSRKDLLDLFKECREAARGMRK